MDLSPPGLFDGLIAFCIERKAFEASHSDERVSFFSFFLFDFALLACKQLEMYDDDIGRALGSTRLISLASRILNGMEETQNLLVRGLGVQADGVHVHS